MVRAIFVAGLTRSAIVTSLLVLGLLGRGAVNWTIGASGIVGSFLAPLASINGAIGLDWSGWRLSRHILDGRPTECPARRIRHGDRSGWRLGGELANGYSSVLA
jgi:hypothetical protein